MNQELGKNGEFKAEKYLIEHGYKIRCKNYRYKGGEIDIVAQKGNVIVFVEVKTRSEQYMILPCESVTRKKQYRIKNTAYMYIAEKKIKGYYFRFDVLELIKKEDKWFIRHIENAFY